MEFFGQYILYPITMMTSFTETAGLSATLSVLFNIFIFLFPTWIGFKLIKSALNDRNELDKTNKPIIPMYYPPENLHPALIGTIVNGVYSNIGMAAGLIDLATNGFLEFEKINFRGKSKYIIRKIHKETGTEKSIRNYFFKNLFRDFSAKNIMNIGFLPEKISKSEEIEKIMPINSYHHLSMYLSLTGIEIEKRKKYFKLEKYRGLLIIFAIIIFPITMILVVNIGLIFKTGALSLIIFPFLGWYIGLVIRAMNQKKTKKGFELLHKIKCYRHFLGAADLSGLDVPRDQETFEKNLPYVMLFGLTEKWIKAFGNRITVPKWINSESLDILTDDLKEIHLNILNK